MNTAKKLIIPGLAALGVMAGAAGTNLFSNAASAESGTAATTQSSTSTSASTSDTTKQAPQGPHQYNGKTEEALTGDNLSKATAAAQAKVSGGTVVRAETDVDGDGTYEVHMQTSDGKMVTVFLDSSFTVTSQTDGMSAKNPGSGPRDQKTSSASNSGTSQN